MKVRAKTFSKDETDKRVVGYYNHRRIREGEMFTLIPYKQKDGTVVSSEQQFSSKWMERLDSRIIPTKQAVAVEQVKPEKDLSEPTGDSDVI